jgi:TatA/E family protein of Tat protein translocase
MFDNIGFGELLVIGLFILIFFGPKKIPDIARTLGKAVREFRRAMQDVQSELQSATGIDLNSEINELKEVKQTIERETVSTLDDLKFSKDDGVTSLKDEVVSLTERKNSGSSKSIARTKKKISRSKAKTKSRRK